MPLSQLSAREVLRLYYGHSRCILGFINTTADWLAVNFSPMELQVSPLLVTNKTVSTLVSGYPHPLSFHAHHRLSHPTPCQLTHNHTFERLSPPPQPLNTVSVDSAKQQSLLPHSPCPTIPTSTPFVTPVAPVLPHLAPPQPPNTMPIDTVDTPSPPLDPPPPQLPDDTSADTAEQPLPPPHPPSQLPKTSSQVEAQNHQHCPQQYHQCLWKAKKYKCSQRPVCLVWQLSHTQQSLTQPQAQGQESSFFHTK